MNVVLIEPPHAYLVQQRTQPPIGLLYLASILREAGHQCQLYRLWDNSAEQLNGIPDGDLYAVSSTSLDYVSCIAIARHLKKTRSDPVILGGYHATTCGDESGVFDAICRGEGERIILDLLCDVEKGMLQPEYVGDPVRHLDTIPFPARDLLDYHGGNIFAFNENHHPYGSTVIVGSRGCPFRCAFCGTKHMLHAKPRRRSVQNVVAEVKSVVEQFNIRQFRFSDETFTLDKNYTFKLCEQLQDLDIAWKCSTRAGTLTIPILHALKRSGCKEIAIGAESGDTNVLNTLLKDQTPEEVSQACRAATNTGINVRLLLMINTPGESRETVQRNIDFLKSTPHKMASCTVFKPLPGSAIWDNPEDFGVEILNRDLAQYNIQLYRNDPQFSILSEPPAIRIKDLDFESMYRNRREMIAYLESMSCINKG